jgi:hypothetical protein
MHVSKYFYRTVPVTSTTTTTTTTITTTLHPIRFPREDLNTFVANQADGQGQMMNQCGLAHDGLRPV